MKGAISKLGRKILNDSEASKRLLIAVHEHKSDEPFAFEFQGKKYKVTVKSVSVLR